MSAALLALFTATFLAALLSLSLSLPLSLPLSLSLSSNACVAQAEIGDGTPEARTLEVIFVPTPHKWGGEQTCSACCAPYAILTLFLTSMSEISRPYCSLLMTPPPKKKNFRGAVHPAQVVDASFVDKL